jgi:hypothetical protein
MRRVLLLASLLVMPAVVPAQTLAPGQITFVNGRTFPMYVNASECASHKTIPIRWNVTLLNGVTSAPVGTTYQLYSSDVDPATNSAGANTCFKTSSATPTINAGQLSDTLGNNPIITQTANIDLTDFITKANLSCASNGTTLFICVEATSGGTKIGFAEASVLISTTIPPPPVITNITSGNEALNVTWDTGTITSTYQGDSYSFQLTAEMIGTTTGATDPNSPHVSSMFTANSARFGGLVNTVVYDVTATTYSKAGNASIPSDPMPGMPLFVNDFWDTYKNEFGGRDSGGCAGGPAGPLALLLLAGALALSRRAK